MNASATLAKKTALLSCGWDPGLFSLAKAYAESVFPQGERWVFWGTGVSQGHSEAVRRIDGVELATAYTEYDQTAYETVKSGRTLAWSAQDIHTRKCFVVAKDGANREKIEREIKTLPRYFAGYRTSVIFLSKEEFLREYSGTPHGGSVVCNAQTPTGLQSAELSLRLSSNPEFTGATLLAYARAAVRMNAEGKFGAYSVLDVPFSYLSPLSSKEQLRRYL